MGTDLLLSRSFLPFPVAILVGDKLAVAQWPMQACSPE
jgi:hypothetical protein